MIRLFTAIQIPETVKSQLLALGRSIRGARWQSFEQLHLTTNFIGDVGHSVLPLVKQALDSVKTEAFELTIDSVDYFGSKRQPRILYAKVNSTPELMQLHKMINNALEELDINMEKRKYKPHITLARLKQTSFHSVGQFLESEGMFKSESFLVDEFHLFSSKLNHEGAQYFIEASYPLEAVSR